MMFMNFVFDRKTRHQKFLLSSFQANLISPGSERQKLHVDTPVPEPLPPWPMKANSIWLLDDFTDKNGATEYVPGSHLSPLKPTAIDDRDVKTMQACAPAGSVIFTHGALWHRAGANKCQGIRVGLLGSFSASYALEIAREEDQSLILDKDTISDMSDNLKRIIGVGHGIKNGARVRSD